MISYYSNKEIAEFLYEFSQNREIAYQYFDKFGKRPNIINYPTDLKKEAEKGMTSIHVSVERWEDPLLLSEKKVDIDKLRLGFDLIIDVDYDYLPYSFITAKTIINFLREEYKIENLSVKFSGNKGFHIGISWESFPLVYKGEETKKLYPELPKTILEFIFEKTKEKVAENILIEEGIYYKGEDTIKEILDKLKFEENFNKLPIKGKIAELNPKDAKKVIINIAKKILLNYDEEEAKKRLIKLLSSYVILPKLDTLVLSKRHLIRAPYSYHEKSGLVSIPIKLEEFLKLRIDNLRDFLLKNAKLSEVTFKDKFLDKIEKKVRILALIEDSINWKEKISLSIIEKSIKELKTTERKGKIEEKFFPPCIKNILKGLEDGKKRALFILMNFFYHYGYSVEEIEKIIFEWNEKNKEKLKENYIKSQLKWFKKITKQGKYYLIPNCENKDYYKDIGVCKPDNICQKIKNPISYPLIAKKLSKKSKEKYEKDNNKNQKK